MRPYPTLVCTAGHPNRPVTNTARSSDFRADVIGPYEGHRGFTFSHSLTLPRNRAAHYAGKTNVLVGFDSSRTRWPGSKLSSEYRLYSLPSMSIEV